MLPTAKRSDLCIVRAQEALRLLGNAGRTPPIAIDALASSLGYQVVLLNSVDDACSAIVSTRDKLIGINGKHHRHRQRFSLGHEIAHIILKHPPESRCSRNEIALYNAEADECAAELLMPQALIQELLIRTRKPAALARIFDVSEEAMTVRLKRCFFGAESKDAR
jgi:hypothetical protein